MATILASQNGNFNSTSTWTGGVVPSTGDSAVANGKTITITASVTCLEIRNDTFGSATAGGNYTLNGGVTLNANLVGGTANTALLYFNTTSYSADSTINAPGTWTPNPAGQPVISHSSNGTLRIVAPNIVGGAINAQQNGITFNGNGNLIITGNITGGGQTSTGVTSSGAGTLTITGNLYGGLISSSEAAVSATSSGTVNIFGNLYASNTGSPNGNGLKLDTTCTSTVNIVGDVVGGSQATNEGLRITGYSVVNVTGNVYGASNNTAAINVSGGVNTVTINGNVTGGTNSGGGISNSTSSIVIVNGNVTGGAVIGNPNPPNQGPGVINTSTGTIYVKRAIGNGFGLGSSGLGPSYGVMNTGTGAAYVQEIQYGPLGMSSTYGRIFLTDLSTNVCLFYKGTGQKTLIDPLSTSGYVPVPSDVRLGIPYSKNSTGTMNVPNKGSVDYGVSVDNTLGTACLSPQSMLNHGTVNMDVSGSIGERVKNAATVATCGQQLANALTDIQN